MDALRKAGDSVGARIRVEATQRTRRPGRAAVRQARRRDRLRDDGHQRGQGRRDRCRLRVRRAARQRARRRADAAGLSQQQRRRRARRHQQRAGHHASTIAIKPTSSIRTPRASIDRAGAPTDGRDLRPPRPLRRHPCDADRRGMLALVLMDHALRHRAQCGDVSLATPPIAARGRAERLPAPMTVAARRALVAFGGVSFAYFAYAGLFQHLRTAVVAKPGLRHACDRLIGVACRRDAPRRPLCLGLARRPQRRTHPAAALGGGPGLAVRCGYLAWHELAWIVAVTVALFLCTAGVIPINEAALAHLVSRDGVLDAARYGRVRVWGSVGFILAVSGSGFVLQWLGVARFPLLVDRAARAAAARRSLRLPWCDEPPHAAHARRRCAGRAAPAGGGLVFCRRVLHRAGAHQPVRLLLALPRSRSATPRARSA